MKLLTITSIKIKTLIATTILIAFSSCSKEGLPKCEKWEVQDEGVFKGGCVIDLDCGTSRTSQLLFCGDALKDARAGNTVTLRKDDCCEKTRTFIRIVP
jgi:hypothetical protein